MKPIKDTLMIILLCMLARAHVLAIDDLALEREKKVAQLRLEMEHEIAIGEYAEDDLEEGVALLAAR